MRIAVAISPNAELGKRDVRLVTPGGISNRFRFMIGDLAEVNEVEPNNEPPRPNACDALPMVVNGQLTAEDRDYFRFTAKAGQTLVCAVEGRTLLPYIPDAVPGWLDACLTLYDADGRELGFVDDFLQSRSGADLHRPQGRRVRAGDHRRAVSRPAGVRLPAEDRGGALRDHVFPLGGQRKTTVQLDLLGVNLPAETLDLPLPADWPARRFVSAIAGGVSSNTLPLAVGDGRKSATPSPTTPWPRPSACRSRRPSTAASSSAAIAITSFSPPRRTNGW